VAAARVRDARAAAVVDVRQVLLLLRRRVELTVVCS
jgi:hypothetical protein